LGWVASAEPRASAMLATSRESSRLADAGVPNRAIARLACNPAAAALPLQPVRDLQSSCRKPTLSAAADAPNLQLETCLDNPLCGPTVPVVEACRLLSPAVPLSLAHPLGLAGSSSLVDPSSRARPSPAGPRNPTNPAQPSCVATHCRADPPPTSLSIAPFAASPPSRGPRPMPPTIPFRPAPLTSSNSALRDSLASPSTPPATALEFLLSSVRVPRDVLFKRNSTEERA
jgi:hypothetical protein